MNDILNEIADNTRERVRMSKISLPQETIMEIAFSMDCDTGFPFENALSKNEIRFICECKQASPSKGRIVDEYPFLEIAKEYESAGASCISVLTEPRWFMGDDSHLKTISENVKIPCLRKDFTVDEYMIYQAKTLGASAVLLICSLSNSDTIRKYIKICDEVGISALVEAHDEKEISSALSAGARMIGVNNRNLKNFTVDLQNSIRLRDMVPDDILFIAESGIRNGDDVNALRKANVDGILIGERLMYAKDKKAALDELRRSS